MDTLRRMAIVLAAGKGQRMKSKLYKVLHPVCGKSMIGHVLDALKNINCERTVVIVGHGAEAVKQSLGNRAEYVLQAEQLGTGHAVKQAKALFDGEEGTILVICGDTPLVIPETLKQLIELHNRTRASATILTAKRDESTGYGRVIRAGDNSVLKIVEHKDCTPEEQRVKEINTGIYCFDNIKLFTALEQIKNNNAQQEYYLTDVISIMREQGDTVQAYCTQNNSEAIGVNDRSMLSKAERLMKERINRRHMLNGVTITDPVTTYIECEVIIGSDTTIEPGTILRGKTKIGNECIIGPNSEIIDSTVSDRVYVKQSVLQEAFVDSDSQVGPFAYLRSGTHLGQQVKVGDFVEIKNASLDNCTKVSHLSYIGDAVIGKNVNIGCGAITVNYDGYNKSITRIGDNAFIGSNVNLVAPVEIGNGAYVVAGSTITYAVPDNDLAIARERQVNKPGYAVKIRERVQAKKEREK